MPNTLEAFLTERGINETEAMNALQNNGIISDNCERASDVANSGQAVAWLDARFPRRFSQKRRPAK